MGVHTIHAALLQRQVRVVVGRLWRAGSVLASGLPLSPPGAHRARPSRRPARNGFGWRKDFSNKTACGSPFSKSEIGLCKSVVLVNRLNVFWELDWEAVSGAPGRESAAHARGYRYRLRLIHGPPGQ